MVRASVASRHIMPFAAPPRPPSPISTSANGSYQVSLTRTCRGEDGAATPSDKRLGSRGMGSGFRDLVSHVFCAGSFAPFATRVPPPLPYRKQRSALASGKLVSDEPIIAVESKIALRIVMAITV